MDHKKLFLTESTSAFNLRKAAQALLGEDYPAWEPESLWLELEQQGITVPDLNKSKLLAAITLEQVPSFYWDAIVYENTSLAFNDIMPNPDSIQEASPRALAWAVVEANKIRQEVGEETLQFDSEPIIYTATVLHRAGFLVPPNQLLFCQDALNRINCCDDEELKQKTREMWVKLQPELKSINLEDTLEDETPLNVQLVKLAEVEVYVELQELVLRKEGMI